MILFQHHIYLHLFITIVSYKQYYKNTETTALFKKILAKKGEETENTMKTHILLLLASICLSSLVLAKSPTQVLCGRRLANTLAYLCYEGSAEKRSGANSGNKYWWASSLGVRGKRDGVVEECCEKPCSLDELLSYC